MFYICNMDISNRIKKVIEYYGYSPSEFADEIDVARSSISHITSGRNKASLDFIIKIKNRFPEIQWDWLIEGLGEMVTSTKTQSASRQTTKTNVNNLFSNISEDSLNQTEEVMSLKINEENTEDYNNKKTNEPNIKRIVFFFEDGKFQIFTP